jgi:hypothetical protein
MWPPKTTTPAAVAAAPSLLALPLPPSPGADAVAAQWNARGPGPPPPGAITSGADHAPEPAGSASTSPSAFCVGGAPAPASGARCAVTPPYTTSTSPSRVGTAVVEWPKRSSCTAWASARGARQGAQGGPIVSRSVY